MKRSEVLYPVQSTDYVVRVGIIPMYTGNSAYQAHAEASAYHRAVVTFRDEESFAIFQYAERE